MRKKSFVPSIALIALAVVCLLVGVGVISFGAGAEGFLSKQRPAFIVDALLCVVAAIVLGKKRKKAKAEALELDE